MLPTAGRRLARGDLGRVRAADPQLRAVPRLGRAAGRATARRSSRRNSVEWIAAALAIQAAGGVMVPIYPANTAAQAAYVAQHSDAKVLFVDTPGPALARLRGLGRVRRRCSASSRSRRSPRRRAGPREAPRAGQADAAHRRGRAQAGRLVAGRRAIGAARDQEEPEASSSSCSHARVARSGRRDALHQRHLAATPRACRSPTATWASTGRDWLKCNAPLPRRATTSTCCGCR